MTMKTLIDSRDRAVIDSTFVIGQDGEHYALKDLIRALCDCADSIGSVHDLASSGVEDKNALTARSALNSFSDLYLRS